MAGSRPFTMKLPQRDALKDDLARARLELLSNTAMLKTAVDSGAPNTTLCMEKASKGRNKRNTSISTHSQTQQEAMRTNPLPPPAFPLTKPSPSHQPATTFFARPTAPNSLPTATTALKKPSLLVPLPNPPALGNTESTAVTDAPSGERLAQSATFDYHDSESGNSQAPCDSSEPPYQLLVQENVQLRFELGEAKREIARLRLELFRAHEGIRELRSLPTGKISQIPLSDMIEIMQEYGSETSSQMFTKRKEDPQPSSIVRQFRRWNPEFFKFFIYKNDKWIPKLGKAGELQRRKIKRLALKEHRQNPPK